MTLRLLASMGLGAALAACSQTTTDQPAPPRDAAIPDVALPDVALPDVALPDAAGPDVALPDARSPEDTPDAARPPPRCVSAARPDCVVDALRAPLMVRAMAVDRAGVLVLGGLSLDTTVGPPPALLPKFVSRGAVAWVDTSPTLTLRKQVYLPSLAPASVGVSAVAPVGDAVAAVNEHACGDDPARLTGPCVWALTRAGAEVSVAVRYRGRYSPDDTVERAILAYDAVEGRDVRAYLTRSIATSTGRRYAQTAVSSLLNTTPPVASFDDALMGRGVLDGWRGGGIDARALEATGTHVRLIAENVDPAASSPLPRPLDFSFAGDASVAARLAMRGGAWFVLMQSPGRLGCSAAREGAEPFLRDVTVLEGADLTAPLSWSLVGESFALDHTGPVRVGGRTFEGPATLVATLDSACRATVIVDLPHAGATASTVPSTVAGARAGALYVAQNFTVGDDAWAEIRAIAP